MEATDELGVDDGWRDSAGNWQAANPDTVAHLREVLTDVDDQRPGPWFVRVQSAPRLDRPGVLALEDGRELGVLDHLPPDLPLGYHDLHPDDGGPVIRVVVVPDRVPHWPARRRWGATAQVFSLWREDSWGVGDLRELRALGRWLAGRGGTVLGINPLGEPVPVTPREPSPYSASSRRTIDPLMIDLGPAPAEADALRTAARLDRDGVWKAKRAELERRWAAAGHPGGTNPSGRPDAIFRALAEHFGVGWTRWPAEYRDPHGAAVGAFAASAATRIDFWAWVAELAEHQARATLTELADLGIDVFGDLPVGIDPDGADAWLGQHVLALDARAGAPPDTFNPDGQDWGLPPFHPHRLRAAWYEPFIGTLRANVGRFAGLRIDHIMGLFRLYWIPEGGDPKDGTYVRFHGTDLIDLVALEATRAGAFVIGEDLGTVESSVRRAMADRGIAGTRVAIFEKEDDERWPRLSLATLTTHDLPTGRGALEGTDPRLDLQIPATLRAFARRDADASGAEVVVEAHRRLGQSPAGLALATMEDVTGSPDRVNLPGTTDEYPNWRLRLPMAIEHLDDSPWVDAVTSAIAEGRDA